MIKSQTLILLITMAIFGNINCASKKNDKKHTETNCFSEENFEKVCQYIQKQLTGTDTTFFVFNDYEIHFNKTKKEIAIKIKDYTRSKINSKGIYSLNKSQKGNEKMVNEAKHLFCILYQLSSEESIEHLIPKEIKN